MKEYTTKTKDWEIVVEPTASQIIQTSVFISNRVTDDHAMITGSLEQLKSLGEAINQTLKLIEDELDKPL